MGRIRTIKPDIALHEGLFELEQETGLPIRFAWAVLPCHCDREGRFKWRPRPLGAQILPYDNIEFSRVLDALLSRGFLVKYRVDDAWYGAIPTFLKHQVINNRESASELPGLEDSELILDSENYSYQCLDDATITRERRVSDASGTPLVQDKVEGKGREGKGTGREGKGDTSRTNSDDIAAVFDHWRTVMKHPKAKLDDKRKRLITAALKLGYSVDDIRQAITGYSYSPFHMGVNDDGQKYDSLDLILRNAEKIDKGLQFHACPPKLMGKQARTEAINQQAVDEFLSGNVGFSFDDGPAPIDAEYETMTGGDHD